MLVDDMWGLFWLQDKPVTLDDSADDEACNAALSTEAAATNVLREVCRDTCACYVWSAPLTAMCPISTGSAYARQYACCSELACNA